MSDDYSLVTGGVIKNRATFIAEDVQDSDWQAYLSWVDAGGVPTPLGVWDNEQWNVIRSKRDKLLKESDWKILPDSPLTEQERLDWETYRQDLRDIPQDYTDPFNVTWPTEPE